MPYLPSEADMGGKMGEEILEGIESDDEASEQASLILDFMMLDDRDSLLSFMAEFITVLDGCPAMLH